MLRAASLSLRAARATRVAVRHGSGGGGATSGWPLLEGKFPASFMDKPMTGGDLVGFDGAKGMYIAGMLAVCVVQGAIGLPHDDHGHGHGHDDHGHEEEEEPEPKYGGASTKIVKPKAH